MDSYVVNCSVEISLCFAGIITLISSGGSTNLELHLFPSPGYIHWLYFYKIILKNLDNNYFFTG
jgi:hypothetical protein